MVPEYKEKELLQRVSAGDTDAFGELFNAWRDKLFAYILRITNSQETAEDVVQDVFLKIWVKREDLSQVNNFNAYIFRTAHNHAVSAIRRMAQETIILSQIRRHSFSEGMPLEETLWRKQVSEKLKIIVGNLPPQQKLVYTLSRERGLMQEEIARRMDITLSTVQNHMTQALSNIRRELTRCFPNMPIFMIILKMTMVVAK